MPRDRQAAIEKPEVGDRWEKGSSERTIIAFKRYHPGTPMVVGYIVTNSTNSGNNCYHPSHATFRRWAATAQYLGGRDGNE